MKCNIFSIITIRHDLSFLLTFAQSESYQKQRVISVVFFFPIFLIEHFVLRSSDM